MADIFDLIPPAVLTGVGRLNLAAEDRPVNQFQFGRWFPNELVDRVKSEWSTGTTRDYTDAAPFRAFTTPPRIGARPGRTKQTAKMAPLSMMYPLSEQDVIDIREAVNAGGAVGEAIQNDVFNDVDAGSKAIENRLEIARADAIVDGTVSIAENGLVLEADFGRDAANSDTVSTGWDVPTTATPLNDEQAVLDHMKTKGLGAADLVAVMNTVTWRYWTLCDQVRNAFPTFRVLDILPVSAGNEVRTQYALPAAVIYDAETNGVDGTQRKLMPDGVVAYLPRNAPVGVTEYGVPAIASDPSIGLERAERPGPVAYLMRELPEYMIWTVVDGLAFPVLKDPNATFVLDVVP